MAKPSDILPEHLKELQTLGVVSQEALNTLEKGRKRSDQLRLLLRSKEAHLTAQKSEMEREMDRKMNFVKKKLIELQAVGKAIEKSISFHNNVDEYTVRSMRALRAAQDSRAATIMSWPGLSLDLSKAGIDHLSNLSLHESIFAERLAQLAENPLNEIEVGLKECETQQPIDLEQEMPPPPLVPKPKKAPAQLELPTVKAMPKMPTQQKEEKGNERRREVEEEKEKKKQCQEYESVELADRKEIPKDHLYVTVGQEVWNVLGKSMQER